MTKAINRIMKEKLRKPKVESPKYSGSRFVSQIASSTDTLSREVEPTEIVRDDRSLFFNSEYNQEKKDIFRWMRS